MSVIDNEQIKSMKYIIFNLFTIFFLQLLKLIHAISMNFIRTKKQKIGRFAQKNKYIWLPNQLNKS